MKISIKICSICLSIFYMNFSYAELASIEPIGNKFPNEISVGQTVSSTYKIINNFAPIEKITYPEELIKVSDNCKYDTEVSKECQVTFQFTAQSALQEVRDTPILWIGPYPFESQTGHIDITVKPGSDAQLGWDTIPTWSNMIEGSSSIDQIYIVRNNGQQTATIDSVDFDPGTDARLKINSDTCTGTNLAQNQSCIIEVEADPTSTGSVDEDLTVTYNGGTTTITTPINFAVNAKGTLSWQIVPSWQDMIKDDPEISKTYSIVNSGINDAEIETIELEPSTDTRLEITGGTCQNGSLLAPNNTCTVTVKADPDSAGKINETLRIDHKGSGSPLITPISFDVNNPRGNLIWDNPTPIVWNDMNIGDSPVTKTYTVRNNGGSDVTLGDIRENPDVQQVTILNTGTCQNGSLLAPNDTCTIDVEANATTVGPIAQNLEVDHNGAGLQLDQLIHFVVNSPGSSLTWEPPIPTWPNMTQGGPEVTQTYTLKNNGSVDVEITTVENLTNPNLSKENDQCSGQIITQNSTCTFDVRANPQTIGTVADTIQVNHNGSNSPLLRSINFTINAPGNLIWHSKPTNWPSLVVGQDDITQTYLVRNNGGSKVTIDDIDLNPNDSRVVGGGTCGTGDLDVNEICTVEIRITPSSTGSINQTLIIEYNNGASTLEDQFSLAVNEAGTLAWEGTNPIWSDTALNNPPIVQTYTVKNTGLSAVKLENISFAAGGDSRLFIGSAGTCKIEDNINPGNSCTINILSNPNIGGQVYQTLQISHDGSGSPLEDIIEFGISNVFCWGDDDDDDGQKNPPGKEFIQISIGGTHGCGIKNDNTVSCWSDINYWGQASPPSGDFTQISAGMIHTCGLRDNKNIACWGINNSGQIDAPSGTFIQVSAGDNHNCAIRESDETVVCWGRNDLGQTNAPSGTFSYISAGGIFSSGIKKSDQTIVNWGYSGLGLTPPPSGPFDEIDSGEYHICGIQSDNTPICWGRDDLGSTTIPPSATSFIQINAGNFHSCGIQPDNSVICWGSRGNTQPIGPAPNDMKFKSIDLGMDISCGILK